MRTGTDGLSPHVQQASERVTCDGTGYVNSNYSHFRWRMAGWPDGIVPAVDVLLWLVSWSIWYRDQFTWYQAGDGCWQLDGEQWQSLVTDLDWLAAFSR